jgi:hypothetical protein
MNDIWEKNKHPILGNIHNEGCHCLECGKELKFNDRHWSYPAFCYNTNCQVNWYNRNTQRHKVAGKTLHNILISNKNVIPTQIQYWRDKGYNEEDSKQKLRERQQTNSLSRYIKNYGEEQGLVKYLERNYQWKESLKRSCMYKGMSNVANELFNILEQNHPSLLFGDYESPIVIDNGLIWVDCLDINKKKIIEFYGDYWHCNPSKYNSTDLVIWDNQLTVQQKWDNDSLRISLLNSKGYDVLVVWESDYMNNRGDVLRECESFLTT